MRRWRHGILMPRLLPNQAGIFQLIHYTQGNLLHSDTEAVVNTVNTTGVMGKGIALAFKEFYPENFAEYEAACKRGLLKTGRMFVTANRSLDGPRWIINFPTKKHWRRPSRFEWITEGLVDLRQVILNRHIRSLAIPPLGCGNGGLEWQQVRPVIAAALEGLPEVHVRVYEPTAPRGGDGHHRVVAATPSADLTTLGRAVGEGAA